MPARHGDLPSQGQALPQRPRTVLNKCIADSSDATRVSIHGARFLRHADDRAADPSDASATPRRGHAPAPSATRIRHAPRDRVRDHPHPHRRADPRPPLPAHPVLRRALRRRGPDQHVHRERARTARRHPPSRVPRSTGGPGRRTGSPPAGPPDRPPSRPTPTSGGSRSSPEHRRWSSTRWDPDYLFLYWYLHRFTGHWPFARTSTEADLRRRLPRPLCSLSSCRTALAQTS